MNNSRRGLPSTELVESLAIIGKAWIDVSQGLRKQLEEAMRAPDIQRLINDALTFKTVVAELKPQFEEFARGWSKLPARNRKALACMADNGWFLDIEMSLPDIHEFWERVESGSTAEADSLMVDHFEHRLEDIKKNLIDRYENRAPIFNAAFGAIKRSEHLLAIPVLLAQADGICQDNGLGMFFSRDRKARLPRIYLKLLDTEMSSELMLSPLSKVLPIYMDKAERGPDFAGLNRHQILHGEVVDYGTHINSLRAVSFLNYIAQTLGEIRKGDAP